MSARSFDALGFDPAPGVVPTAEEMARTLREITRSLGDVDSVARSEAGGPWQGKAADTYRGLMSAEFAPRLSETYTAFSAASRALDRWVLDLADHQERAARLEREAAEARQRIASAASALDGLPEAPGADADRSERDAWDRQHQAASSTQTSARGELDAILARARTLAAEATESARSAAGALDTAMRAAPDEPGLFDKIGKAFKDVAPFLSDVVEYVKDDWWDLLHQIASIAAVVLAVAALLVPGVG